MSAEPEHEAERRIDGQGIIWVKVVDKGSFYVVIRPLGSWAERTVLRGTWSTWDRHSWDRS